MKYRTCVDLFFRGHQRYKWRLPRRIRKCQARNVRKVKRSLEKLSSESEQLKYFCSELKERLHVAKQDCQDKKSLIQLLKALNVRSTRLLRDRETSETENVQHRLRHLLLSGKEGVRLPMPELNFFAMSGNDRKSANQETRMSMDSCQRQPDGNHFENPSTDIEILSDLYKQEINKMCNLCDDTKARVDFLIQENSLLNTKLRAQKEPCYVAEKYETEIW